MWFINSEKQNLISTVTRLLIWINVCQWQWEKKCKVQSIAASSGLGPTNDIQNQVQYGNFDNFGNNNIHSVESSSSISVLPLHSYTNEYQVSNSSYSGSSDVSNLVSFPLDTTVSLHAGSCSGAHVWSAKDLSRKLPIYISPFVFDFLSVVEVLK